MGPRPWTVGLFSLHKRDWSIQRSRFTLIFMKLHPAEIASEIMSFPFFKNFDESILLQISTMIQLRSVEAGECILIEGQTNKSLYFLRQGSLELFLNKGQNILRVYDPGDVFGEMSVITQEPVSTTVKAIQDSELFELNTENFGYVHPNEQSYFELMLYKIFCNVLIEKIKKTNSKIVL